MEGFDKILGRLDNELNIVRERVGSISDNMNIYALKQQDS
jgi:hypothetical protein